MQHFELVNWRIRFLMSRTGYEQKSGVILTPTEPIFFTMEHYREIQMGVVVFAKVQGLVKSESPRTHRLRGL